ncbi:phenylacetate--CoA ligase family protein [Lysobacter korlensis]|uniref:Phenylacetate--CoA ligase family protein n=1 Tax=Lysobacter korlensis TaxID=553636 RepID=A0ABV6RWV2_9GAMM
MSGLRTPGASRQLSAGRRAARAAFDLKSGVAQPRVRRAAQQSAAWEDAHPDELRRFQRISALELVRFAFDSTAFYRDRYREAGFTRDDLFDPDVFESLPVIEKAELRERRDDLLVAGVPARRRLPSSTGGSTGEPLRVLHDRRAPVAAMWWRIYRWWGIHPGDDKAFVQRERRTDGARLKETLEWWPTRHRFLDARSLTPESMAAFAEQWRRHPPALVNGYVGGLTEFAAFLRERGLRLPAPRAIGVTAAPITPSQRAFLRETLRAPVFDQYRSAEVPWIAAEAPGAEGLFVLGDLRVVEILDDEDRPAPSGVEGDVVVTDLCNRVFPLIRYRLGDRTRALPDAPGGPLRLPRIAAVQGRVSDVLRLPNGARVSGGLTGLFNARPDAVRQFQVHQQADAGIVLRCVPGAVADADAVIERAAAELRSIVEGSVPVLVQLVDSIPHDRGKARVVISDVPATEVMA